MNQGIILVDKPIGWTSFDVVNYIRKIVATKENKQPKAIKVGHCGTLDPFASGLLIILVGKDYTKQAMSLTHLDKVYKFRVVLGKTSNTGDSTGEISSISSFKPNQLDIIKTLECFKGTIYQTPPNYSAIKINGQKAYQLARSGVNFKLQPRKVTIHNLKLIKYDYPLVSLEANVSSGTYIRSLASDIGDKLGIGAYVQDLKRAEIANFKLIDATKLSLINQDNIEQFFKKTYN